MPDNTDFLFVIVVVPQRTQVTNIYLGLHSPAGDELNLQANVNKSSMQMLDPFIKGLEHPRIWLSLGGWGGTPRTKSPIDIRSKYVCNPSVFSNHWGQNRGAFLFCLICLFLST